MKKILITLLLGMFLISFTIAYEPHKQNTDLEFGFTSNNATSCNVTVANTPYGVLIINQESTKSGQTFNNTINGDNFSIDGSYCFNIVCSDGIFYESGVICRDINEGGIVYDEARTNGSIFLIFILCLFFVGSIIFLVINDNYIGKFVFYWVSHLLLVLILFISWQLAVEGLFGTTAITVIFKILFYVAMISVFPMIILSLAWIFYIHTFNEHFQKLVDKGESPETAFNIANKKSGGWRNGQ